MLRNFFNKLQPVRRHLRLGYVLVRPNVTLTSDCSGLHFLSLPARRSYSNTSINAGRQQPVVPLC